MTNGWVINFKSSALDGTLENGGTVQWIGDGNFALNSSAVLTNRPGARLHVQNAASIQENVGGSRIDNVGIFRKSANAGTTTIGSGISFNNSGAVEVEAGTLLFNGGPTNSGAVSVSSGATNRLAGGGASSGTSNALANAVVEWSGGTFTLNPGAQLNGAGLYRITSAATVIANTDLLIENLDLFAGTRKGQRKDDVLQKKLRQFKKNEGVIFVGVAQAKVRVPRTTRRQLPEEGTIPERVPQGATHPARSISNSRNR